ncbi:tetratricopeptide repeat protein [Streptomyces sp. B-S-A8]|uniref:Tetratricopeptide repeat protein n=1 Tax=Streptomyces solicavernae TaxID=3043614 RepID=A0ABT6RTS7_9ACTN|nr:tetratricopeptide repeat protein [Streptomyces sp. B-S-A8]MDI3387843.1 tetratricopeptide repeat protein [Streptomyces sp. B-S-A8]
MTDRFDSVRPDGRATEDRWAGALHLFDDGPEGAVAREESPVERWERAGLLFGEKRYGAAARLLAEVVEEFPEHTAARMLLARAYYHSAQLGRAEAELRELVERDPVDAYAHLLLGRTLERQSRKEEAAPWLRMARAFSAAEDD